MENEKIEELKNRYKDLIDDESDMILLPIEDIVLTDKDMDCVDDGFIKNYCLINKEKN